jgi:MFS family permease
MSRAPAPVRIRWLTALCYLAMMSLAIGLNLLPVFLTTLSHLYGGAEGLSKEALGRLGAVGFSGLVAGILVTGPLADRAGAKPFALLGNGCIAVSLVGLAYAPSYAWLSVAMAVLGLGAGMLDMVLSPVVAALHPEKRGAAMNWLHSFYCVGAVVTIFVGSVGLQLGLGWRGTCLILLPLPVGLILALGPLRFPTLVSEGGRTPFLTLLKQRWFLGALIAIFLGGATEAGMAQWLPAYAELSLGFSTWMGGLALLLFSLAMALGRMGVAWVGPRWNPYTVMAWGCGLSALLFLAASLPAVAGRRPHRGRGGGRHGQLPLAHLAGGHRRPAPGWRRQHVWRARGARQRRWHCAALGRRLGRRSQQPRDRARAVCPGAGTDAAVDSAAASLIGDRVRRADVELSGPWLRQTSVQ